MQLTPVKTMKISFSKMMQIKKMHFNSIKEYADNTSKDDAG